MPRVTKAGFWFVFGSPSTGVVRKRQVAGVEEGMAGGAERLREDGAVVAVARVARRAVGSQERGGHAGDRGL